MKQTMRIRQSAAAALLVLLTASPLLAATSASSSGAPKATSKTQKRVVRKVTRKTTTHTTTSSPRVAKKVANTKVKHGFRYSSTVADDDSDVDETMNDPELIAIAREAKAEQEARAKAEADAKAEAAPHAVAEAKSAKSAARGSSRTTLKSARKEGTSTVLATEGAQRVRRAVKSKVEDRVGISAPTFGDYVLSANLNNLMTMGRKYELEEVGGQNFWLQNEIVVGIKHKSGWGIAVSEALTQTNSNADTPDSRGDLTDATVRIGHPAIYKSDVLSIGGQLRAYIPTSNASHNNGRRRARYYSFADITMPKKWGLSNTLMAQYQSFDAPKAETSDWFFLESFELTHQTAETVRFGIGQQTQFERHIGSPAGTTVEVYPFVDITWIPNVLIEPKLYLPVFVNNVVGGAPSVVAMSQLQAELFVKIGF